MNGIRICSLVSNPKDGMPDFHDSLWSGFTILPIVERLRSAYPEGSARLHLRASADIPFMTLRPVIRSMAWVGFDGSSLSMTESDPEYRIIIHDPVDDEHEPPLPLSI